MQEDRLIPVFGILGFALVGALVLLLAVLRARRSRKEQEREELERAKKEEEGIALGVLARDPVSGEVYPRCVICGGKAVSRAPVSGVSWMDQLPLLNRLFSLPPRYTIVDNEDDGPQYCKIHKGVAIKKLEQFHAALRAERSQFNANQADKVAQMDAGGLHQILLEQHQGAVELLEQRKEKLASMPALPPASPSTKRIVSTMTTSSSEEDEDRPKLEVVNGS